MRQVQEEELSALLDGELDSQRAEEVRALVQADPALREQLDALAMLDARLWRAGAQAAFSPEISFSAGAVSEAPAWHWPAGLVVVLALIVVRLLPKLVELPIFGIGLQLAAFAAIVLIIIGMTRESEPLVNSAFGKGVGA